MLKYERYTEQSFALFEVEPETPFSEWLRSLKRYSDEGETKFELYDVRRMTLVPTEDEIRHMVSVDAHLKDRRPVGSKTAIVVHNAHHRWLVRFYGILSGVAEVTWETQSFMSFDEALSWLGVDIPT